MVKRQNAPGAFMDAIMNNWHRTMWPIVLTLIFAVRAFAGTPELSASPAASSDELTLGNFFTEGWNEEYNLRTSLPDGAPDLPLFHAPTNFLVRVTRTDYSLQNNLGKSGTKNVQFLDQYIDYAFNQRFMLSLFGNYTWLNQKAAPDEDGAGGGMIGRFQLVDTPTSSDCLNLRVDLPDKDIGVHTTKLSAALAGWQDLSPLGAGRLGIYYDLQEDAYTGFNAPGATRDDVAYDVAIAKTWTKPSASVGYLTTFVEFSGATNLDGDQRSVTGLTATPALQFILGGHNLFMLGVDFPLTHPSTEREVYRITYIYCF
jgi:hypothetical protein